MEKGTAACRLIFICAVILLSAGCGEKTGRRTETEAAGRNNTEADSTKKLKKITKRRLSGAKNLRLFTGDVYGNTAPEIIITDRTSFSVFTAGGEPLSETEIPEKTLAPSFLYDYDRDGKLDLLCGSTSSENIAVTVLNGCGSIIQQLGLSLEENAYSSIYPQFISADTLYCTVKGIWADSPRGAVALELPNFDEKWTFFIPSDPIKISMQYTAAGDELFTISHITLHTGRFSHIGTGEKRLKPGDNSIRLFRTNPAGEVLCCSELLYGAGHRYHPYVYPAMGNSTGPPETAFPPVRSAETPLPGRGEFFALGPDAADSLLLVQTIFEDDPAAPYFYLHLVDGTAENISATTGPFPGSFKELQLLPEIVILWKPKRQEGGGPDIHRIDLLSLELQPVRGKQLPGSTACLGPVLAAEEPGSVRFFAAAGDSLFLFDGELNVQSQWPADSPVQLGKLTSGGEDYLAAAGGSLEVWRLEDGTFEP